ncbi:MAG TPA: hypothetical protein PK854_11125 [Oscillospiraceae bacterium]|nr:hypothetical protein [Oscillospiraceae bacterium]HPS35803.1 hypothetical protein [Oscillospiraceae bacterium]
MNLFLTVSAFFRSELALLKISPYVYIGAGVLAVLLLFLALRARKSNTAEPAVESAPVSPIVSAAGEGDELIAVIAAAVYAFGESTGKTLAIRSVRRIQDRRPVWASAGVYENTRPF